ncbi:MAG: radical SAM protein [Planctomycetes bacterium]|nr:radical SAM protein [Planctomycetota bacterium]
MTENKNTILLIEPPFNRLFKSTFSLERYPSSLGYLSGVIRQKTDWHVLSYVADFSQHNYAIKLSFLTGEGFRNYLDALEDISLPIWEEVKTAILDVQPDVIGITAKSQNFASACIVAKIAKQINEKTTVVMGGPHPSMIKTKVLDCQNIDIGVIGEGERTIIELLDAINSKKKLNAINGIVFRDGNSTIETARRELIDNLDSLPFPVKTASEVLMGYEKFSPSAFRNVFATRGCPNNCFFCGSRNIWTRKVRFRSVENVVEEIQCIQKLGVKSINYDDDTFGVSKNYIRKLCNAMIEYCPCIKWKCEIHVRLVDDEIISLMKRAGCHTIQIGIESGNNQILKEMRKDITIEKAYAACRTIKKYGIKLHAFFIVGFPQETEETLDDTVKAMMKIDCDELVYSIFTPYPGTEAFEFCKEKGLIDDSYNVSLHNHQSPASCFCLNITPERFRVLAAKVEKMVDKRNAASRKRGVFSVDTFRKIQEFGIKKSIQKGVGIFFNK